MLMPGLLTKKAVNRQLFLMLIGFSFLLCGNFIAYSQTTSGKLVKCRENGKTVYRTKCRSKKKKTPILDIKPIYERYGDPYSKFEISDGPGSGGGIGTGRGTGQGEGSGNGVGRGTGSGSGAGNTDSTNQPAYQPPANNSRTAPLKIISIPRPGYNDEARNAQVQGTVTLKVMFLANGQIGSVSVVAGLPNGLNDQAVRVAKLIKFEPAMKKGKPVTVIKQVIYNFTLY